MTGELPEQQPELSDPRPQRGSELKLVLDQERRGDPFLLYRTGWGELRIVALAAREERVTIGRDDHCDVALPWDGHLSRSHAELVCIGGQWTLVDDGLSRNGTFVNDERVAGRRRLDEGDMIRAGATYFAYRYPGTSAGRTTHIQSSAPTPGLTPMQRKVLIALARPLAKDPYAAPASNRQIADELVLSIDAIKSHMRGLFEKFDVGDLPQNQKRARVVQVAFQRGLVSQRELTDSR